MTYKVVPWSPELDLTEFYASAEARGFHNNSSQERLIDCFKNERAKQVWILYNGDRAVGSVAAHSFDDVMGLDSYRIAARTCVFTDQLDGVYGSALRTISVITKHQNPTAQFLIPACLSWVPPWGSLYITSNESLVGTQRRVHNIFGPALEKQGVMKRVKEVHYRGTDQTVWEFNAIEFVKQLDQFGRWDYDQS
jgi:hypothetical protein